MALFNYSKKEINAKIVYYGPGLCGKTTNLQFIHDHLKPDQRGKMVSLATEEDRTLFFDFLPLELESVRGFKTRFQLYTVPGQVHYGATRRAVLTGADGIIFIADSQGEKLEENLLSLQDLEDNLRYYGKRVENIPLVVQYNKRDLPGALPMEVLNQKINRFNAPYFESVATLGRGVFETLIMTCRMVLKGIEGGAQSRRPPAEVAAVHAEPAALPAPEISRRVEAAEDEKKKEGRRAIFSRLFEKEKHGPLTARIASCGQPRISPPGGLEIPLIVEIEGLGKKVPLSIHLTVHLDSSGPKAD